ncbi:MAG TPA: hypothetical protein VHM30_09585 [Gemmatimonadaceae bacterium]|nr:hypothetical protein [Gemmatimonadaceae bacterium]
MRTFFGSAAIPIALVMLALWAVGTFYFEAPGWFHGLLTAGIFLLLWGIVARPKRTAARRPE